MARVSADIDDGLLAEAARILGTTTKAATVRAALADVVKRHKALKFLDWLADGGLPELTGPVESSGRNG
ncbi:type II toxin-antitoxin system VapB family antitoxin [Kitasatospora sp. NPDC094011]|uniref:type II toxin-antitoxin system VapB family antitoxin n=1 Tax=Kitasatospora sp. NPDC094011 TaxID=3364090 RepID=UPI00382A9A47